MQRLYVDNNRMRWMHIMVLWLMSRLCSSRKPSVKTIAQWKSREHLVVMQKYIVSMLNQRSLLGIHIPAIKLMRCGQNQEALMLLEPAINENDFALQLYIDIRLIGRKGIRRDIDRCEQLLFRRLGITDNLDMTSLLNLCERCQNSNLLGLLHLLLLYNGNRHNDAKLNAHLLLWSEGSLYGTLALLCTFDIELRHYKKLLKDDEDKEKIDKYRSLSPDVRKISQPQEIVKHYKHPLAQLILARNLLRIDNNLDSHEHIKLLRDAFVQGLDVYNNSKDWENPLPRR
jgi:hypothetical protein